MTSKCINLKEQFRKQYRIGHDPAAKHEPGGMADPWLYTIPCKYGEIYPYGGERLALHCQGSTMRQTIKRRFPKFEIQNWSDDGEATFLFHVDDFEKLAKLVRPKRKPGRRKLSDGEREKLIEMGREHRFKGKSTGFLDRLERK